MRVPLVLLGALLLTSSACTGSGVNTKPVYAVQGGTITLGVSAEQISPNITEVEFFYSDPEGALVSIGKDTEGPEFSVQFDTTKVENGVNLVSARGYPGDVDLLKNSIFVVNETAGAPAAFRLPSATRKKSR